MKVHADKLADATEILLGLAGDEIELAKLHIVLYFAERISLVESHRPIFGGPYFASEEGPRLVVFGDILQQGNNGPWMRRFRISNCCVTYGKTLSRGDKRRLTEAFGEVAHMSFVEVIGHIEKNCAEWAKHRGRQFTEEDVFLAAGFDPEIASAFQSDITHAREFQRRCMRTSA